MLLSFLSSRLSPCSTRPVRCNGVDGAFACATGGDEEETGEIPEGEEAEEGEGEEEFLDFDKIEEDDWLVPPGVEVDVDVVLAGGERFFSLFEIEEEEASSV